MVGCDRILHFTFQLSSHREWNQNEDLDLPPNFILCLRTAGRWSYHSTPSFTTPDFWSRSLVVIMRIKLKSAICYVFIYIYYHAVPLLCNTALRSLDCSWWLWLSVWFHPLLPFKPFLQSVWCNYKLLLWLLPVLLILLTGTNNTLNESLIM